MANEKRLAVLIDAENVSPRYIKPIMDELTGYGVATYKRIYGDWTNPSLGSWKAVLLDHSIIPVQQYSYTQGKNASDSAMIIDAMDILYSGHVDGFCLVSSDSDFTRLAARLRESAMMVIGMGEKKTPPAFVNACNQFRYLEVLAQQTEKEVAPIQKKKKNSTGKQPVQEEAPRQPDESMTALEKIKLSVAAILDELCDGDDWVPISEIGNRLLKRYPDFDTRNFGHRSLTRFIKAIDAAEMKFVPAPDGGGKLVYARPKQNKS